jgi:hypothetical protein
MGGCGHSRGGRVGLEAVITWDYGGVAGVGEVTGTHYHHSSAGEAAWRVLRRTTMAKSPPMPPTPIPLGLPVALLQS